MRLLAASLLLLAGPAAVAASGGGDAGIDQARKEAAAATAQQQRLEQAAASARDEASRLRLQQIAAAQAIAAEEAHISASDREATVLRAALARQDRRLAAERAPLSSLLSGLALMGRRPPIALIADSGSARDLVRMKLLIGAITPAIEARTAALVTDIERSRSIQLQAGQARNRALASRKALEQQKTALARLEARSIRLAETRGVQAFGAGDVALARGEEVSGLERQGAAASSARANASELLRFGPALLPASDAPARVSLAYQLPVTAPITEGLGDVSDNGVRSRGVTFATRRGATVLAPAAGTILFSGPFNDYDGVAIIDHGGGWRSVLVNVGVAAPKGTRVEIGQKLGIALGPLEVQLQKGGAPVSAALIAGSSAALSNRRQSD